MNAIFVVPVFNEAENIEKVLQDLASLQSAASSSGAQVQFLFVDDGSTDGTAEMLERAGRTDLKVVRHEHNQGPGAAFRTAFDALLAGGLGADDLVITLEGDATSDPAVFPRMLQRTQENDDLILASPYLYGGGFTQVVFHRLLISHIANFLFKMILGVRGISTFSCFFRIYRGRTLTHLKQAYSDGIVHSTGFECAAEILIKSVRQNLTISEVPFCVDWARRRGASKMRILKTSWGYLKLFWRYRVGPAFNPWLSRAR